MTLKEHLIEILSNGVAPSKSTPQIPVHVYKSGAVSVDVKAFLSSDDGKKDLKRAQEAWEEKKAAVG